MRQRRLFCDINPTCYAISMKKENYKRSLKDRLSKEHFAGTFRRDPLPRSRPWEQRNTALNNPSN